MNTSSSENLTMTVGEAGRLLGISRATAYSLVAQGKIPALRLGRRIIIPRKKLEELLDGSLQQSNLPIQKPEPEKPKPTPVKEPPAEETIAENPVEDE